MKQLYSLLFFILIYVNASAQILTTIAGGGSGDGGSAVHTSVAPAQLAVDNNGTIYYSDNSFNCTRKIVSGTVNTILNFTVDALQVDAAGNIYYALNMQHKVFKRSVNGTETLFAGTGIAGNTGDNGPATSATIGTIASISVAPNGAVYLQDTLNHVMRVVNASGTITSISSAVMYNAAYGAFAIGGTSTNYFLYQHYNGYLYKYSVNSSTPASISFLASVSIPNISIATGIAATSGNIVYVAGNNYIYKITAMSSNNVSLFAGTGVAGYNGDGISATTAQIALWNVSSPLAVSGNNVFLGEVDLIRQIDGSNIISTIAGMINTGAVFPMAGDGLDARMAGFALVNKISTDASGNIYLVDINTSRVRKISVGTNIISTFAGGGTSIGDNGPATSAKLLNPTSIAFDNSGNAYIVDAGQSRIRKVDASGTITTYAGGGTTSIGSTWTTATNMNLGSNLNDIVFANGKIYFTLFGGNPGAPRLVYVNSSGILTNSAATFGTTLMNFSNMYLAAFGSVIYCEGTSGFNGPPTIYSYNTISNTTGYSQIPLQGAATPITCDNMGNIFYGALHYIDVSNNNHDTLLTHKGSCIYRGNGIPLSNYCGVMGPLCSTPQGLLIGIGNKIMFACVNSALVNGNVSQSFHLDTTVTPQLLMDYCNLYAGIQTSGNNPASGTITSKVSFNSSVPYASSGNPYVQRHYDLEPLASPSYTTGTLTLFFTQTEFDNYNIVAGTTYPHFPANPTDTAGIAHVRITQVHGTGTNPSNYTGYVGNGPSAVLIDPADSNIVWNSTQNRWEITFNVTGFSGFYLHTTNTAAPLSVHLLSFTGQTKNQDNLLIWQTSDEQNNAGFEVERSIDAVQFEAIGQVQSKGYDNQT
ncbi:MAG: hypothetical protein JST52_02035, partial [Bacteroidetes bacterium]|nr:hypothetical protein [Bacteroidota bacterium]